MFKYLAEIYEKKSFDRTALEDSIVQTFGLIMNGTVVFVWLFCLVVFIKFLIFIF